MLGTATAKHKLNGANLEDAKLQGAYLNGAKLERARFDKQTILPDGARWTPDTDMTRYTNPDHPDFWQPDWAKEQNES